MFGTEKHAGISKTHHLFPSRGSSIDLLLYFDDYQIKGPFAHFLKADDFNMNKFVNHTSCFCEERSQNGTPFGDKMKLRSSVISLPNGKFQFLHLKN